MAKKRRKKIENTKRWGLKEVIKHLEEAGAREITDEMMKKEPYKSVFKNVIKNGKIVCK